MIIVCNEKVACSLTIWIVMKSYEGYKMSWKIMCEYVHPFLFYGLNHTTFMTDDDTGTEWYERMVDNTVQPY